MISSMRLASQTRSHTDLSDCSCTCMQFCPPSTTARPAILDRIGRHQDKTIDNHLGTQEEETIREKGQKKSI